MFATPSRFQPIDKDVSGGARAIRVQSIPNGAVGRPVEFERKFRVYLLYDSYNMNILINFFRVSLCI